MDTDSTAAEAPGLPAPDSASTHIDAPPEQVWDMVADITRMGEWSPETFHCRWVGSVRRAEPGAKFIGFNKQGWKRWATRNVVVEAERGKVFAFRTRDNNTVWTYRLELDGGGTRLTETRQLPAKRPYLPTLAIRVFLGGLDNHDDHIREGIAQTLERIKTAAEA